MPRSRSRSIIRRTLPRLRARAFTPLIASLAFAACSDAATSVQTADDPVLPGLNGTPPGVAAAADPTTVIPGEYIVTFASSVSDSRGLANALLSQHGGRLGHVYSAALKGFSANLSDAAVAALAKNPQIARIEPDALVSGSGTEASPTWGLDRIDQRSLPLDRSYTYASSGAGVNVYILDTGIRTTHVEFGGRASGAFTAINDGKGTNDCNGHGTHVAGTVGGATYGVAKSATLYAVRVLDCANTGTVSGLIAGIDWVTQNRRLPAVANLSLTTAKSSSVNAAIQASIDAGVVYAVAAGNNGADACNYSPASAPAVLTVGASGNTDGVQGFSNVGPCVDLFAPGQAIRSAYYVSDTSSIINAGTSMASPHVAGAAAVYLSANPTATPAQVTAAIIGAATTNALTAVPAGTANRLLYVDPTGGAAPPPPVDTTTPPPPPPPTTPPPPPTVDAPPTASFSKSCNRGTCTFDASASSDDVGIVSYAWSFGDGTSVSPAGSLMKTSHTFTSAGSYMVVLTVTDAAGHQATKSLLVTLKKV